MGGLDFTAIDVATANHRLPGSVCGVGLVRVRDRGDSRQDGRSGAAAAGT